ncbi:hypothetical protein HNY73_018988 [Argiope bruennichi]|uniref:Uncharacterized protein n=1 Tax=Argiope bruennichi TaxID=94029 RepID=A0A8T0EJQ8_ARGBR|nr:hypothetical protein HNY73_018988 [Argiope bruennichi]
MIHTAFGSLTVSGENKTGSERSKKPFAISALVCLFINGTIDSLPYGLGLHDSSVPTRWSSRQARQMGERRRLELESVSVEVEG